MKNSTGNYILYALGTRGSRPVHGKDFEIFGGQTTCYIIKHEKHAVIIDCGTGLYDAGPILSDCNLIDVIFTHVHYDHILGLLDFSIFPKDARINFMGTFKSWFSYDTIDEFYRHPFWPIQPKIGVISELSNDGTEYNLSDNMSVRIFDSSHPDSGNILLFDINGRTVCFMFDIEDTNKIDLRMLANCNYLIFDGMYDDYEYNSYVGWGHSTYQEGCRIAAVYNCGELLITHHNPKSTDKILLELEKKAKLLFPKTRFCRAGDMFNIE